MEKQNNKKALLVIPFAGGSAYSLNGLMTEIKEADFIPLELPGRGKRIRENLLTNIGSVVDDLYEKAVQVLNNYSEYYVYGHSMGTLVGFLLIHKIVSNGGVAPQHFYVSGRGGPSKKPKEEKTHLLPSKEFRDRLRELGGSPQEILENEDLMDFFEPIIRADFGIVEEYVHEVRTPLNVPITGFFGTDEETTTEEMQLWQNESVYDIAITEFPGNHFFIFDYWKEIGNTINLAIGKS